MIVSPYHPDYILLKGVGKRKKKNIPSELGSLGSRIVSRSKAVPAQNL